MSEFSRKRSKSVVGEMRASLEGGDDVESRRGVSAFDLAVAGAAGLALLVGVAVRMGYVSSPAVSGVTARLGDAFSFSSSTAAPAKKVEVSVPYLLSDPRPETRAEIAGGSKPKAAVAVASIAPAPTRSAAPAEAFALDRDGACLARGLAAIAKRGAPGATLPRSAQLSAVEPIGFGDPSLRAAYDSMIACVVAKAGPRLCEAETRQALVGEVSAYLNGVRAFGAKDRKGAGAARPAAPVLAALAREAKAGRLVATDFADQTGPELAAMFAGRLRRGGC